MQFERMLITGLQRRLHRTFNLPQEPALISTTDRWKLAERIASKQGKPGVGLPVAFLTLKSLTLKTDGYNLQSLQNRGLYAERKTGETTVKRHTLLPARYEFEFVHLTQDFFEMLAFARTNLMHVRNRAKLNFTINYDGIPSDVRVALPEQVTTPEKDAAIDVVGLYETILALEVDGFVTHDLDDAADVPIVLGVNSVLRDTQGNELGAQNVESGS